MPDQFEYMERASKGLEVVVPATLLIIFVLLSLTFKRTDEAILVIVTLPFAVAGGVWLLWMLEHHISVASAWVLSRSLALQLSSA